jgi:hypothetical protein
LKPKIVEDGSDGDVFRGQPNSADPDDDVPTWFVPRFALLGCVAVQFFFFQRSAFGHSVFWTPELFSERLGTQVQVYRGRTARTDFKKRTVSCTV